MFENTSFIKPDIAFSPEYSENSPAPLFRKKFNLGSFKKAVIYVCALGYGYFNINGKRISPDLFTAPVSEYNKTLWYTSYDVSNLLQEGENCIAAICGNGFFNEAFKTSWDYDKAAWRDNPKFILELQIDGKTVLKSDSEWKFSLISPIIFNNLRSGEYFDSRLYSENWDKSDFDDSSWKYAIQDNNPPKGIFRECLCEPIREFEEYKTVKTFQTADDRYVFDIGQNISGYIRLKIKQQSGDVINIRYSEELNPDNSLNLNNMYGHYKESPFQTDKFICNGEDFTWSPLFCYHGFRYIELSGLKNIDNTEVSGIFVHQAVNYTSSFECSDKKLEKLFEIGRKATLSNLFYMPTDCPTREKLGWANDAQASAEQMLINFNTPLLFKKWLQDIYDSMRPDGSMPGIIPSSGWGYEWGNGPVSDGVLFEIPYMLYLYTGDKNPLLESRPYFERYIDLLKSKEDSEGFFEYGLNDWAPPEESKTPLKFICSIFFIKFLRIAALAESLAGDKKQQSIYEQDIDKRKKSFKQKYIQNGICIINEQTALAMLITHALYDDLSPLKSQLETLVKKADYHHNCGMVGLPHLYKALNICKLYEYAYKIITAKDYPSYDIWLENDATTLWEMWQGGTSKNHHMYSDFMAWIMKTLVGINPKIEDPGFNSVEINPQFIKQLDYCKGFYDTIRGKISVSWQRKNDKIHLEIEIPKGVNASFNENILNFGKNTFVI